MKHRTPPPRQPLNNTHGKTMTPEQYARFVYQLAEWERMTGKSLSTERRMNHHRLPNTDETKETAE